MAREVIIKSLFKLLLLTRTITEKRVIQTLFEIVCLIFFKDYSSKNRVVDKFEFSSVSLLFHAR